MLRAYLILSVPTKNPTQNTGKFLEVMGMLSTYLGCSNDIIGVYMSKLIKRFSLNMYNFFVYQINLHKAKNSNSKDWKNTMINQTLVFYDHWGINEASQVFWGPWVYEEYIKRITEGWGGDKPINWKLFHRYI